jgi:phospho-N-acetylmuramoyl-pentapeptide-transferase
MDQIQDPKLFFNVIKVLILGAVAFVITILWTPLLTNILYRYHLGKNIRVSSNTPIYTSLHQKKAGTPTMGGILIWLTTLVLAIIFWVLANLFSKNWFFGWLNFLNRPETLLPLGALVATAIVGLVDDLMNVFKIGSSGGGLRMKHKLLLYTVIAAFGAWWFFYKLGWDIIHIPGVGDFSLGRIYIPLFIFVIVATSFSVNEADGLDGLAGGILLACFGAYSVLAFSLGKINLAAFCAVICGALLAFLWFNIYPARFFMGDTGAMSLGTTLGIIAMLTNSVLVLPIIALPLVIESGSVILQLASKKIFGRKIFKSTPIHHHFEAIGWPETKVTMRFWIIAAVSAALGVVIGLIGKG